ncbi:MAG TPA: PP2C family protein-serine/threonine phosphatase [Anaerolineales bacterium]|nr:PP2C family protein-serine/threonine phosphatase [Anaerolineales bacterium]
MTSLVLEQIRASLAQKREGIAEWLRTTPQPRRQVRLGPAEEQALQAHLVTIDTALEKAAAETLGTCTVCHESVEDSLLEMDYTAEVCLDHLSTEEMRHLEFDLELAQSVQKSLLPQQLPDVPGLEVAAFSRPAQILGGDYFDFFRFQDGIGGLAIADVAGHGLSAGLHMAGVQALLRTLVPVNASPSEVVGRLQRLLIHNVRFSTFVTLFLGSFDHATRLLRYCNAGHNPPLLLRSQIGMGVDPLQWLEPTGAAIGLLEESQYREQSVRLEPGDVLLLYTDGVTEASDDQGKQFGQERLAEIVRREAGRSIGDLVRGVREGVLSFARREALADDVTIVACRVVG